MQSASTFQESVVMIRASVVCLYRYTVGERSADELKSNIS